MGKSAALILLMVLGATLYIASPISIASAQQQEIIYPKPYYPPYLRGPYVDRIVFRFITEGIIIWEMFKRGEISTAGIYPPGYSPPEEDWLAAAEKDPGIMLVLWRSANNGYLGFNVKRWPTSELAVRRAIAHLIDYDYAITTIWKPGFVGPTWGYAPPLYKEWINPNVDIRLRYPYSLELAKKELEDAGWVLRDGKWYSPEGKELGVIKYVCPGYSPQRIELGLKLKEDAAKIGIEIDVVHPPDWPSTERMTYVEKDFNIFANYATADPANPARWYFWAFHSSSYQPPGVSSINHFGIQDPELDALVERLKVTMNIEEAKSLVWKIQKLIEDKCYVMPLPHVYAWRSGVRVDQFENWIGLKKAPEISLLDPSGHEQPDPLILLNAKPVGRMFGGTLVVNRPFYPSSFNPLNWMEAPELSIFRLIYLPLAFRHFTPDGEDKVIPALAYDWKVEMWEISPGKFGLKYTFYLYNNVTWHDGVPVTSEDVKFTYDLIAKTKTTSAPFAPVVPIYVKSETPDKHTVIIYTNDVGIFQFYDIISPLILPKHIWEGLPDPFAFENDPPIGNGPFIWESYIPREYISLRANPRYHLAARTLSVLTVYKDTVKIAGERARFQFKLTGPEGEAVTNGTVKLTLMKAGEEVFEVSAGHIGGGVYEANIDTGVVGVGDYVVSVTAEYVTPLFTYQRPLTLTLTVLPEIYRDLINAVNEARSEISSAGNRISALENTVSSLQERISSLEGTISGLAAASMLITASIGVSVVAIILALVAIILSLKKR
ncbi:MAG: ABC transporter substrate-binding protein [Candidatus Bathyarchaeia archaeon]